MNIFDSKERFQRKANEAGRHRELVNSPEFLAAIDAALLAYGDRVTGQAGPGPSEQAAGLNKLAGAREFVGVLINLAEKFEPKKATVTQNLKPIS